jgi:hypothetical protein
MNGGGRDEALMAIRQKRKEKTISEMTLNERVEYMEKEQEAQGALLDYAIEELRKLRERLIAKRDTGDIEE